jgi:hypothetical protein
MVQFPASTNVSELRGFLGLVAFYRQVIYPELLERSSTFECPPEP